MRSSTLFLLISAMVLALVTLLTIFVFFPVAFGTGLASLLLILLALPDLVAADTEHKLKEGVAS